MWNILPALLLPIIFHTTFAKLVGDHVCQSESIEPVEFTEWFLTNRSIRHYEWCWNVPPRCSSYSTKLLNESRIVIKNVTVTVEHCCEGFQAINNECISLCPDCVKGICRNGECLCSSGWRGALCDSQCLIGQWGSNCTQPEQNCNCLKYIQCHAKDLNDCDCITGWLPDDCNVPCPKPYFGKNCSEICKCNLHSKNCTTDDNECKDMFQHYLQLTSEEAHNTDVRESSDGFTRSTKESTSYLNPVDLFDQLELQNDNFLTTTTSNPFNVSESYATQNVNVTNISIYDEFLQNLTLFSSPPTYLPIKKLSDVKILTEKVSDRNHENISENQTVVPESKIFRVRIFSTMFPNTSNQRNYKANENLDTFGENKKSREIPSQTENIRRLETYLTTEGAISHPKSTITEIETNLNNESVIGKININNNNNSFESEDLSRYEKDKKTHLLHESLTTSLDVPKVKVFEKDESTDEEKKYIVVENLDRNMYSNHRIIQYVSIAAIVTLIVVTTSVGLLVHRNIKRTKKDRRRGNVTSSSTSTVAVYTTSIFHTPLPDPPPSFENPIYLRQDEYPSNPNMRSFQTEVVCNTNFKKPAVKEIREYTYDYPPSTGSYRATSTIDAVSEVDITQKLGQLEPLYDEIPSRDGQIPVELEVIHCQNKNNITNDRQPKNLYMNTCESTKF